MEKRRKIQTAIYLHFNKFVFSVFFNANTFFHIIVFALKLV